jgi:hypothetical protein
VQIIDLPVPAGDYQSIKFAVRTLRHPTHISDALKEMEDHSASIIVDGKWTGADGIAKPFTFQSAMRVAQKTEGKFTFGAGLNPATLIVNPAAWFVGADGAPLDPDSDANRGAILANIRCSMRIHAGDRDDDGEKEASTCGAVAGTAPASRDEPKPICRSESAGQEAEDCHHCCKTAALLCLAPAPPPAAR